MPKLIVRENDNRDILEDIIVNVYEYIKPIISTINEIYIVFFCSCLCRSINPRHVCLSVHAFA